MKMIKKLIIQFFILLLLLSTLELSVRLFYNSPQSYSLKDFILSEPQPFLNDPDYNVLVKNFTGECKMPAMLNFDGVIRYADNFSCGGVSYYDGKRVTIPKLEKFNKTIHVFGGSTVWGTGATDENTIPSLIAQNLLGKKIRVLNYGIASYVSSQQNTLLRSSFDEIKADDIVVYYDGGNDYWNGVMQGNAEGNILGYNVKNKFDLYIYILKNWLSQNLHLYQLLYDLKHNRSGKENLNCSVSSDFASSNISSATSHYASQIELAKSLTKSKGAEFYHFLQPTLFDVNELTSYENRVLLNNPCWSIARDLKEEYDKYFLTKSLNTKDLSEILNNKDVFFDYIHVSAKGNKIIVEEIIKEIGFLENN